MGRSVSNYRTLEQVSFLTSWTDFHTSESVFYSCDNTRSAVMAALSSVNQHYALSSLSLYQAKKRLRDFESTRSCY